MRPLRQLLLLLLLTLITGVIYPLGITGLAQALFPYQANGSLIVKDGVVIGSELIGQNFTSEKYFHGRPSVTTGTDASGNSVAGSNAIDDVGAGQFRLDIACKAKALAVVDHNQEVGEGAGLHENTPTSRRKAQATLEKTAAALNTAGV